MYKKKEWKEKRRGLANDKDCVDESTRGVEKYIKKGKERIFRAANNSIDNVRTNRKTTTRKLKWEEKYLYWYFKRQTGEITHKKTGKYWQKGNQWKESESLLIAAQNTLQGLIILR